MKKLNLFKIQLYSCFVLGVCRMVAQPGSSGEWTVYMHVDDANIEQVSLYIYH